MPERIANIVLLVEDQEQQNLAYRSMKRCNPNLAFRQCRVERPAKRSGGSGEKFVRDRYSVEVREHRRRVNKGASALLVVMIDADMETTRRRATQLSDALRDRGMEQRGDNEPIVVLIPKRHVETWIRALLGNEVDEETDYKNPKPTHDDIGQAAEMLHQWTRRGVAPSPTSPPSLTGSLPEWQKIP